MLGDSMRRRRGRGPPRGGDASSAGARAGGPHVRWGLVGGVGAAIAAVAFLFGYTLAVRVIFPPVDVTGESLPVPSLLGHGVEEAGAGVEAAGFTLGDVVDIPDPAALPGTVVAQSPLGGQRLRPGASVSIAVSSGPPRLTVPDLVGFPYAAAAEVLERAGVSVEERQEEDEAAAGRVLASEPEPGTELELPASVILVVSSGPPPEVADTLGGDTLLPVLPRPPLIPPR